MRAQPLAGMDPIDPNAGESFAWCWSHGRLHRFRSEPWCTATWTRVAGSTEPTALGDKTARIGDARFLSDLPLEVQVEMCR